MPRPILVLLALLALGGLLWFLLDGGDDPDTATLPGELPGSQDAESGSASEEPGTSLRGRGSERSRFRGAEGPTRTQAEPGEAGPGKATAADWLAPFRAEGSEDAVEAVVFHDRTPVTGGRLVVHLVGRDEPSRPLDASDEQNVVVPIDAEGKLTFGDLPKARSRLYLIQVEVPGRPVVHLIDQVWNLSGKTRFVRLGSASLHGTVRFGGGPSPHEAYVVVTRRADAHGTRTQVRARIDQNGDYEAGGLDEGRFEISLLVRDEDGRETNHTVTRNLQLGFKQRKRFDIGPSDEDPILSGTIATADGAPPWGAGVIVCRPAKPGRAELRVAYDADGRFRTPLAEGSWTLMVRPEGYPGASGLAVTPRVVVVPHAGPVDLKLAGASVAGAVEGDAKQLTWRYDGHAYPSAFRDAPIKNRRYRIDGVSPGKTIVISWQRKNVKVDVPEGATRVSGPTLGAP